jgi:hypothetical protein
MRRLLWRPGTYTHEAHRIPVSEFERSEHSRAATVSATSVFINSQGPYMTYSPSPRKAGPFGVYWTQPQFQALFFYMNSGVNSVG